MMNHKPDQPPSLSIESGDFVSIFDGPLPFDQFYRALGQPVTSSDSASGLIESGAIVTFSGVVRQTEGDRKIPRLDYEHYQGMAEREMSALIGRARQHWTIQRAGIWHRIGAVPIGESTVLIGVCAGHRQEAFEAARFLIDELKKSVPIWKQVPK